MFIVPSLHRVYVAAQGTRELVVIDEDSFKIIHRVAAGDVDANRTRAAKSATFVSDESDSIDAVIDITADRLRRHIRLDGEVQKHTV